MNAQLDHDLETIRRDRTALVAELDSAGVRWSPNGKDCRCCFHDDANPSAGIFQAEDSSWKFKCFVCGMLAGDLFDVRAKRTSRPVADVLRDWRQEQKPDRRNLKHYPTVASLRHAATYQGSSEPPLEFVNEYLNTDPQTGQPVMVVFRLKKADGSKTFRQGSWDGDGWVMKAPAGRWPLWNRTRIHRAQNVVLVEGEECVLALTPILPEGWAATTNHGGAETGRVALTDWTPLAGKAVWLWPDADPPDPKKGGRRVGLEHMQTVSGALGKLSPAADCYWIDPDTLNLPAKGDVVDWLNARDAQDGPALWTDLRDNVLDAAHPIRASAALRSHYRDIASGRLAAIPWPWDRLSHATQALQPGRITMLCGKAGAGKSFMLVECLWNWLNDGHRTACLMLELDAVFHAKRLHAMLARQPGLLDMDWVRLNGATVDQLYVQHAADLDVFWSCLDTVPGGAELNAELVLKWLRERFRAGIRVAVVDPLTAISGDKPWITDRAFLFPARQLCEEFGTSLVLATHPDRGGRNVAGSEAMKRFVDTIIWLIHHDQPRHDRVMISSGFAAPQKFNRSVRVTKARLARGAGGELAFNFSPEELKFTELGIVVGQPKETNDEH